MACNIFTAGRCSITNCVWLHFFHIPPYTEGEKKHLNVAFCYCQWPVSNPGCLCSKRVCTIHYSFASRHELTRDIEWRFCAKILANNSNTIAKVATAVASETTASMTSSQPHELLLQQKQKMRWLGRSKHHIRSQRCESRPLR